MAEKTKQVSFRSPGACLISAKTSFIRKQIILKLVPIINSPIKQQTQKKSYTGDLLKQSHFIDTDKTPQSTLRNKNISLTPIKSLNRELTVHNHNNNPNPAIDLSEANMTVDFNNSILKLLNTKNYECTESSDSNQKPQPINNRRRSFINNKPKTLCPDSATEYKLEIDYKRRKSTFINSATIPDFGLLTLDNRLIIKKTIAALRTQPGIEDLRPKVNQDACLFKLTGLDTEGFNFFGVMDGHGSHGHFISQSIKVLISEFLLDPTNYCPSLSLDSIYSKFTENEYSYLKQCYMYCETSLAKSKYEVSFSGTSAVIVVQIGDSLICANAGDSRAILCKANNKIIKLSNDHKPNLPIEKERILASGGRVERIKDRGNYIGSYRVWLKSEQYPGLAMSRSLGDFIAKSVGCISEPEIIEAKLTEDSRFLIVGSDGVWEFLSDKDVYKFIEPFYNLKDPVAACNSLIEESTIMWKLREKDRDDITCVVAFFYS